MARIRTLLLATTLAGAYAGLSAQSPAQTPAQTSAAPATALRIPKERVTFKSGDLTLVGFLFKPGGAGPFPTVIWNHGSEKNPGTSVQFDSVAAVFVPAGFAVFAPMRRGHGFSQGTWISDSLDHLRGIIAKDSLARVMVHLMTTEQLDDQLAGVRYARQLKFVDTTHMFVAGCSYGGIETLLAAERGAGFKAAISISPAALSWQGNVPLQQRLVAAVRNINIPVLLMQPPKDKSLEPLRVLGDEFKRLNKPFTGKLFPAVGPEAEQGHCFGGAKGMHVWAPDAVAFLRKFAAK